MFINLSRTVFDELDSTDLAGIKPWPLYRGLFYQDAMAQQTFYSYDRAELLWDKVLTVEGRPSRIIKTQKLSMASGETTQVQQVSALFWVHMYGVFISDRPQDIQFGASFTAMQLALKVGPYTGFLEHTSSAADRRFFTASLGIGRYPFSFYGRYGAPADNKAAYQLRYRVSDNDNWQDVAVNQFSPE